MRCEYLSEIFPIINVFKMRFDHFVLYIYFPSPAVVLNNSSFTYYLTIQITRVCHATLKNFF